MFLLAQTLPRGLFYGERVALFLRANNDLYQKIENRWLTFKFFDLFNSFELLLEELKEFKATIIVAPAQVLRQISLAVMENKKTLDLNIAASMDIVKKYQNTLNNILGRLGVDLNQIEWILHAHWQYKENMSIKKRKILVLND